MIDATSTKPIVKKKKYKKLKAIAVSPNNTKLGKIPSFSLPAISSCPGATSWCTSKCYADKISRIYKNAAKAYLKNFHAAKSNKDFVSLMNTELDVLRKKGNRVFRMHVSGDFYDVKYIYDWVNIAKLNPDMQFYGYTRSWSVPGMLSHLEALRCLPNVILFASTDIATTSSIPTGWREAFAGDFPPLNLVKPKMIMCLEQAGKLPTCDACKLCFNTKSTVDIYFKTH